MDLAQTTAGQEQKHLSFVICWLILEISQYVFTAETTFSYKISYNVTALQQELTHCGVVILYGGIELGQHWLR